MNEQSVLKRITRTMILTYSILVLINRSRRIDRIIHEKLLQSIILNIVILAQNYLIGKKKIAKASL